MERNWLANQLGFPPAPIHACSTCGAGVFWRALELEEASTSQARAAPWKCGRCSPRPRNVPARVAVATEPPLVLTSTHPSQKQEKLL